MAAVDVLRWVGSGLIVCAAAVGTASVLVHLRVFDRRSRMSRHLLGYMTAIAVVLDLSVIRLVVDDSLPLQLIRLAAFAGVLLFMAQRLYLQIRAQRETNSSGQHPREDDPRSPRWSR